MTKNILPDFYREKVEGGGHINLRKAILRYLSENSVRAQHYLDIGCADGSFTIQVANIVEAEEVFGVDLSSKALGEAERRGIKTCVLDINKDALPFDNEEMDLITSFEVIEHLLNPDNLISESYRVLRENGKFIVSTPNLASWTDRIYLLMGYQPRGYEVSLKLKLDGVVKDHYNPAEHIRLYTIRSLKEHLLAYGFKVKKIIGCPQPISIHKQSHSMKVKLAGYVYNSIDRLLGRIPSFSNSVC
jgi:2-polyprenyl-3-methyl-5-hydroxy-6-metoxy-1,4-benzoquinol methylase